jgi:hypothetical protein
VHLNSSWKGSLISKFTFHLTRGGHGSSFIDVEIMQSRDYFIAGWEDGSINNGSNLLIIWLKGGGTTYFLNANATIYYQIYDGIQFSLPYQEENGQAHSFKTNIDEYVLGGFSTSSKALNIISGNTSYFNKIGIGIRNLGNEKFSVNGTIRAKEIKVEAINWPDYVFEEGYQPASLEETEVFIKANKHLPGIPSAAEVAKEGISLGEMNVLMMKKIEELTLHVIALKKQLDEQMKVSR